MFKNNIRTVILFCILNLIGMLTSFPQQNTHPYIKVSSPSGGEQWKANSTQIISWQSENISKIKIEYSLSNGLSWHIISSSLDASLGKYSWTALNAKTSHGLIRISDISNPQIFSISDESFSIVKDENKQITKSAAIDNTDVKIMPLGDSITLGSLAPNEVGYREALFNLLTNTGYNFTFVGTQETGLSSNTDFFKNGRHHEGHGGWSAYIENGDPNGYSLHDDLAGFLGSNPPNIILLHIGTNDIGTNYNGSATVFNDTPQSLADEVVYLLDTINNYDPNIITFLARIINRADSYSQKTTDYNDSLQHRADSLIALGRKIVVVNMESALIYPTDLADWGHPNTGGYQKMADAWFNTIQNYYQPVLARLDSVSINQPDTIILRWNAPPAANGLTIYQLQISTDVEFSNLILDDQNVLSNSKLITGLLQYDTQYYWRVRIPSFGWSSVREFTNSPPSIIISTPKTVATIGQLYSDTVRASAVPAPKYYLGTHPAGMVLDSISGILQWAPSSCGNYQVKVIAKNTWGEGTLIFNIEVNGEAPVITSTPLTSAIIGQLYLYEVNATGIPQPTFNLSAGFAIGMTLDSMSGVLQWTPTKAGNYNITIKARNGINPDAAQFFTINVPQPLNAPKNLCAVLNPIEPHKVKLIWVDNSNSEVGFVIERKTGDTLSVDPFIAIDSIKADITFYEDSTITDSSIHSYRVNAFNADYISDYSNLAQITTLVPLTIEVEIDLSNFSLNQNYPNPFNQSTTIQYTMSSQQYVTLTLYNLLGNEVLRLAEGVKPAGVYQLKLDAKNIPSGVYFYRIQSANFIDTKKMILMK